MNTLFLALLVPGFGQMGGCAKGSWVTGGFLSDSYLMRVLCMKVWVLSYE